MYPKAMSSDNDWQAECDARTLSEAEVIKADADRLNKATSAAKKMAEREEKEKASLRKVAAGGMIYDKSPDMMR